MFEQRLFFNNLSYSNSTRQLEIKDQISLLHRRGRHSMICHHDSTSANDCSSQGTVSQPTSSAVLFEYFSRSMFRLLFSAVRIVDVKTMCKFRVIENFIISWLIFLCVFLVTCHFRSFAVLIVMVLFYYVFIILPYLYILFIYIYIYNFYMRYDVSMALLCSW